MTTSTPAGLCRVQVAQAWDAVAKRQAGRLTLADVATEASRNIPSAQWLAIKDDYIAAMVNAEDAKRTHLGDSQQLLLFSGAPAALDGYWALGGGDRVQVGRAVYADVLRHMQQVTENVARVNAAAARKQQEIAVLTPYFRTARTTVAEARAAYQRAHPQTRPA